MQSFELKQIIITTGSLGFYVNLKSKEKQRQRYVRTLNINGNVSDGKITETVTLVTHVAQEDSSWYDDWILSWKTKMR